MHPLPVQVEHRESGPAPADRRGARDEQGGLGPGDQHVGGDPDLMPVKDLASGQPLQGDARAAFRDQPAESGSGFLREAIIRVQPELQRRPAGQMREQQRRVDRRIGDPALRQLASGGEDQRARGFAHGCAPSGPEGSAAPSAVSRGSSAGGQVTGSESR